MKSLFNYITEKRQMLNVSNLTLQDIRILTEIGARYKYEPGEDWMEVWRHSPFNEMDMDSVFSFFTAYYLSPSGMNKEYTEEKAQKLLNLLEQQPLERIQRILGAGAQGMVFDLGDGKVMKMLFDTTSKSKKTLMIKTWKKMIGKKFETLPIIYKVTDNYMIRESLIPGTSSEKCKELYDVLAPFNRLEILGRKVIRSGYNLEEIKTNLEKNGEDTREIDWKLEDKNAKKAYDWLYKCAEELRSLKSLDKEFGDFRLPNLGETKDGRIVYHDWFML